MNHSSLSVLVAPEPITPEALTRPTVVERIMLELQVDEHRCLSCGGCVSVCPRMNIPVSHLNSIAAGVLCKGCGICVQACPVEALHQRPVPAPPRRAAPARSHRPIIPAYPHEG
jgi:Pyruvate/2-oxoacid:ferredoxin oxidoreductase delta subunit